jgi:hypothetical protein
MPKVEQESAAPPKPPEMLLVDGGFEIMTDEQLVKCLHGAAHELFLRATGEKKRGYYAKDES